MWREETKDILQVNSNVVFWYLDIVILNICLIVIKYIYLIFFTSCGLEESKSALAMRNPPDVDTEDCETFDYACDREDWEYGNPPVACSLRSLILEI